MDLESARRSLRGDSYLHCIFGCQQALEKVLKALVVNATGQAPPRTHNLVRLLALARVPYEPEQEQFLSTLSLEYIDTRYPGELESIAEVNNRATAEDH